MLEEIEKRKRRAEVARSDELPSKWDNPYSRMGDEMKSTDEGLRAS